MNKIISLYLYIKRILKNIRAEHIGAFAAQSSFFFIMSFFPLTFLILTVLNLSQNSLKRFTNIIANILPYVDKNIINSIFENISFKPTSVISVTTLLTAWSAGKGFHALAEGFQSVLSVPERRNYFVLRFRSLGFSVAFAIIIAVLFFIGVFGDYIHSLILEMYPFFKDYSAVLSIIRIAFIISVLFVILSLVYIFLPDWNSYLMMGGKRDSLKFHFISSLASSVIIYLYTVIFSFVSKIYISYNSIYGGISTFISVMLWIYGSMYILILGFRFSHYLNTIKTKKQMI